MKLIFRNSFITRLLRITLIMMFLGRAWQHLLWEGPYRNIFYNPHGFGKFLSWVSGRSLVEIYADPFYENLLDFFYRFIGIVFLSGAISVFFYKKGIKFEKIARVSILTGMFATVLLSYGYFVGKHYLPTMFFEYSIQMTLPLVFLWSFDKSKENRLIIIVQFATAITFLCHGLFAYGFHSQPGGFADMLIVFFGVTEEIARKSLVHIGELDFVFAGVILIPFTVLVKKSTVSKIGFWLVVTFLAYGVFWGYATAFARILVHYDYRFPMDTINGNLFQTLVRLGHGTFPLILLIQLFKKQKQIRD